MSEYNHPFDISVYEFVIVHIVESRNSISYLIDTIHSDWKKDRLENDVQFVRDPLGEHGECILEHCHSCNKALP